jgi:hypothetical protein
MAAASGRDRFRVGAISYATSPLEIAVLVLATFRDFKAHAGAVEFLIVEVFDRIGRIALVFEFDEGCKGDSKDFEIGSVLPYFVLMEMSTILP